MARFMVSMPEDMLEKLDRQARLEHRTRSELLREAVRRHLAASSRAAGPPSLKKGRRKKLGKALEQYMLHEGLVRRGCPGLDSLLGPLKGPVDMRQVLKIGKKLTGLSREIIEAREDRV